MEIYLVGGAVRDALMSPHSAASEPSDGWGETSCQALRYPEALVAPKP
jgi:tRNA nucleotidyltransferase/poly(A) polymerase